MSVNLIDYFDCETREHLNQVLRKIIVTDTITGNVGFRVFVNNGTGLINSETFMANGVDTDFTVSDFTLTGEVMVFVNGALQVFGWVRMGSTIRFNAAPALNTEIVIIN